MLHEGFIVLDIFHGVVHDVYNKTDNDKLKLVFYLIVSYWMVVWLFCIHFVSIKLLIFLLC